jgi:hypothetical protein
MVPLGQSRRLVERRLGQIINGRADVEQRNVEDRVRLAAVHEDDAFAIGQHPGAGVVVALEGDALGEPGGQFTL